MENGKIEIYGYIRVSTREQNEDRQRIAMQEIAVPEQNIYMDKQSGKNFERPNYKKTDAAHKKRRHSIYKKYRSSGAQL